MSVNASANMAAAIAGWGEDMPRWVRLLASACDSDNQRVVAERLGKSSGYVSRILRRVYSGSYEEAEKLVRAAYGHEDVICPLWGAIPLASCIRARRRKAVPRSQSEHEYRRTCPTCPNNTDRVMENVQ